MWSETMYVFEAAFSKQVTEQFVSKKVVMWNHGIHDSPSYASDMVHAHPMLQPSLSRTSPCPELGRHGHPSDRRYY